jgi:hypothetical protein
MTVRYLVLSLVLFSVLSACKTSETVYRFSITPGHTTEKALSLQEKTVVFETGGVWGAVVPVSYEEFSAPASLYRGWNFPNPFEGVYDEYERPIVFFLVIENRSATSITFNPSSSFSVIVGSLPLLAIEYDDLYQNLYQTPGGTQRLASIRKMLFNNYQILETGEDVRGLLLFRRPEPRKREAEPMAFRLRGIYVGPEEIELLFPFQFDMVKVKLPSP